jgi:rhodanese-related sulfurtransferase
MRHRICTVFAAALLVGGVVGPSRADEPLAAADTAAPRIGQDELLARLERKDPHVVVLDVRTPGVFAAGHVPGARNVSHDQLAGRLGELAGLRDEDVVLYCRSGRRTAIAADVLRKAGFTRLMHLDGDYLAWEAAHRPVETSAAP